jgi:hypothetical protein
MAYTKLTEEKKYYLEKLYSYISRDNKHTYYKEYMVLNNSKYAKEDIQRWIHDILTDEFYTIFQARWINALASYYTEKRDKEQFQNKLGDETYRNTVRADKNTSW